MKKILAKLSDFIKRYSGWCLAALILLYIIIFFGYSWLKYVNYQYNALDLGIYGQVFYNSSQGDLMASSIHPPSYLGDHFEPIILLLAPIYKLLPNPLILLLLQTIFLALAAWPLFCLAKPLGKVWALLIALFWLLNPFVQNINIFEFHILSLAPFCLLWTYFFWQKKNFFSFLLFFLISLLIREDVALCLFMFGLLSLFDSNYYHRDKQINWPDFGRWVVLPLILSAVWFWGATKIISLYNAQGAYKFLFYYSILGKSWGEIILNLLIKPWLILKSVFTFINLFAFLGLLLPLMGLPILAIKPLIIALPIFLQYFIPGQGITILSLHYTALILPWLFIAFILAWKKTLMPPISCLWLWINKQRFWLMFFLALAQIYFLFTLGPLPGLLIKNPQKANTKSFLGGLPADSSVMASDYFLPYVANRQNLYLFRYWFWGKQQFAQNQGSYSFPADTQYILLSTDDLTAYQESLKSWVKPADIASADQRLSSLIDTYKFGCDKFQAGLIRLKKNLDNNCLYQIQESASPQKLSKKELSKDLTLLGYDLDSLALNQSKNSLIKLYWQGAPSPVMPRVLFTWLDQENKIIRRQLYPVTWGFLGINNWPDKKIIAIQYPITRPPEQAGYLSLKVELVKAQNLSILDLNRSINHSLFTTKSLGQSLVIPIN